MKRDILIPVFLLAAIIFFQREGYSSGFVGHIIGTNGDTVSVMLCGDVLTVVPGDIVTEESIGISLRVRSIDGIVATCTVPGGHGLGKTLLTPGMMLKKIEQPVPAGAVSPFVDNGDGTVTDSRTGLVWLRDANSSCVSLEWKDALEFCGKLRAAGYGDWRLPTKEELDGFIRGIDRSGIQNCLERSGFRNVRCWYWSSTECDGFVWSTNLDVGTDSINVRTSLNCVWPVRGKRR
jgi:hypothetical protein